jgi:hypothetical protein
LFCSDRDGIKEKELLLENKIRPYEKGVTGKVLLAIAKANGISIETMQGWVNTRKELKAALLSADVDTQKTIHLNGGGHPAKYAKLEEQLHS